MIPYSRIKKKSLTLAYVIYPRDYLDDLISIRYKKLQQSILKEDLRNTYKEKSLLGHSRYVTCLIKINKNQIVSSSYDFSIKLWDLISGKLIKTLSVGTNETTCLIKLSETKIASGGMDKQIKIWDLPTENV